MSRYEAMFHSPTVNGLRSQHSERRQGVQCVARALLALGCMTIALVCASAASPTRNSEERGIFLVQPLVRSFTQSSAELDATLDLASGPVGKLTLFVPSGFELYPQRPEGSPVGSARIRIVDESDSSLTLANVEGEISSQAVASVAPTTAASCAVDSYSALWSLQVKILGQRVVVPIFVGPAAAGDPPGSGLKLELCAPTLTGDVAAERLPVMAVTLAFPGIEAPQPRGNYVWRAFVTPLSSDRRTLATDATYELRAIVPVPHTLTLRGRYISRSHL